MAAYVGLHAQIKRNNSKSILLLMAFPALILLGVYAALFFLTDGSNLDEINYNFITVIPVVLIAVGIWFFIAYFLHSSLIQHATHSAPLERASNMRVYNLTENLCMSVGMKMPKLYIIETDALNAFASGINEKTYSVTLTRGIINTLNDEELEGVIAHELTHIRNKDVRLLIVTIVFVGIFGVIVDIAFRSLLYGNHSRKRDSKDSGGAAILIILLIAVVLYFFSMIFKFALSRSREYMADAGAVELTKNAQALSNALRKISGNSTLKTTNDEVKELFIDNGNNLSKGFFSSISNIFATHPPIEKRIKVLEQL
ncbi:MAG: M48 family metalloprotease [Crocinitomicaceae bacterium]|nr:M48 family metalloprotease [Crocinitomicaceae bacterium]